MPQRGVFGPSETALAFGERYGEVLAKWAALFESASALVQANVELGKMANDAATEFDEFLGRTANGPWSWLNPDMLQRFMTSFSQPAKPAE